MKRSAPLVRKTPLKPGKGLKPSTKRMKSRRRATKAPTKAEKAHQALQRAHGCAMCRLLGVDTGMAVRIHHRTLDDKHGQLTLGEDCTVALCDWHHQGILLEEEHPTLTLRTRFVSAVEMLERFGPSLYHHKVAFVELIQKLLGTRGTRALQDWQDEQLADAATWPGPHA